MNKKKSMARFSSVPGPPLGTLSPDHNLSSSPPWYRRPAGDSDTEDQNHNETEFDFLAGASTPLNVNRNKSLMFISPMKGLDKLHLSPGAAHPDDTIHEQRDAEDEDEDEDDDEFSAGDKTIHTETSSDAEEMREPLACTAPTFISQRKRRHTDSPLDMEITPGAGNHTIPHGSSGKDMSGILGNETYESILKMSFSASDSTPCPTQPRKKLRFKKASISEETTPSQPSRTKKPLLNFSCSRKLSANGVPLIHKLNDAHDEPEESVRSLQPSGFSTAGLDIQSTPISQSTPANSRATSPCISVDEADDIVNGFKFIKPSRNFSYRTPQARLTSSYEASQRLINAYNTNNFTHETEKYEIVGEFLVSAAGLMAEDAEDIHVGDKRINDPYLVPPPSSDSSNFNNDNFELRQRYLVGSDKLPLLQHFERDLTKHDMLYYINDHESVSSFYEYIFTNNKEGEGLLSFLKKERLRWHPDKWIAKYANSIFDKEIIDSLSQVINSLIDEL